MGVRNGIVLNVNFIEGTIKTKTAIDIGSGSTLEIDGYFGLNPLAVAAKLPLGLLGGFVNYNRTSAPTLSKLDLIGQIGQTGVVGIYKGAIFQGTPGGFQILGGFTAFSSEVTANAREFNTKQAYTVSEGINSIDFEGHDFRYADVNGNVRDANVNYRFGLGGVDNSPATNPNGFTFGAGNFAVAAGIWTSADLGLLLPQTPNAFATWTGTIQTLKTGPRASNTRAVGTNVVESDFTIQVNFELRKISTVSAVDTLGAVTLGTIDLTGGDKIQFTGADFDGNGIIGCPSTCRIDYTIGSTTYGLVLTGLIGQKGALGIFRGSLSNSSDIVTKEDAPAIVGGFQVTPDARGDNS